jgi:hypothetical protein
MTAGLLPITSSCDKPLETHDQHFFFHLKTLEVIVLMQHPLMRGWVCHLQLLLVLASTVILRSESHSSHDHILLSDSRLPQPGGPGPRIYIPHEQGGPVIPSSTGLLFRRLLQLAGLWWRYSTLNLHIEWLIRQIQIYFTIGDLLTISSSWRQAPWDSRSVFFSSEHLWSYSLWNNLSNERTGLSLIISTGFCQQSFSGLSPAVFMTTFYCLGFEAPPNLEGQIPIFISSRHRVAQLYPQASGWSMLTADRKGITGFYSSDVSPQFVSMETWYWAFE